MHIQSEHNLDKNQRWWHLACIQIMGGFISIPVISLGLDILTNGNGLIYTLCALFFGELLLFSIAYFIAQMAFKKRLNAVENIENRFGRGVGRIFTVLLTIPLLGWIAIQLWEGNGLISSLIKLKSLAMLVIGVVAFLLACLGMKVIRPLAVIMTPVIFVLFGLILYNLNPQTDHIPNINHIQFSIGGIGLALSTSIATVVDLPTFYRYGKSEKDVRYSLLAIFIVTVLFQFAMVFFSKHFRLEQTLLQAVYHTHSSFLTALMLAFFLISTTFCCTMNIYAAFVALGSQLQFRKRYIGVLMIAVITLVGLGMAYFENAPYFLVTLCDACIAAFAGMLLLKFFYPDEEVPNIYIFISAIILFTFGSLFFFHKDPVILTLTLGFLVPFVRRLITTT